MTAPLTSQVNSLPRAFTGEAVDHQSVYTYSFGSEAYQFLV